MWLLFNEYAFVVCQLNISASAWCNVPSENILIYVKRDNKRKNKETQSNTYVFNLFLSHKKIRVSISSNSWICIHDKLHVSQKTCDSQLIVEVSNQSLLEYNFKMYLFQFNHILYTSR